MNFYLFDTRNKFLCRAGLLLAVSGFLFCILLAAQGFIVGGAHGFKDSSWSKLPVFEVQTREITNFYQAVGSVRPWQEPVISARVQARVKEVLVSPGDRVQAGDLLIKLDDRELKSRLKQAEHNLQATTVSMNRIQEEIAGARARLQEARSEYERIQKLYVRDMASAQELDRARSAYLQARAGHEQARTSLQEARANKNSLQEKVSELEVMLGHTRIQAPGRAEVVKKYVDPGDMAAPGKPLLQVQTRHMLRMEALVPERLLHRVELGKSLQVHVPALDMQFKGQVQEIEPAADPAGRNFLVKLALEHEHPGLYPGMFARMRMPVDKEEMLLIPESSVRRIGQLATVQVLEDQELRSRHVRLGREIDSFLEVLSGLEPGEIIKSRPERE